MTRQLLINGTRERGQNLHDLRHYGILSPVFGLFEQLPGAVEAALLH